MREIAELSGGAHDNNDDWIDELQRLDDQGGINSSQLPNSILNESENVKSLSLTNSVRDKDSRPPKKKSEGGWKTGFLSKDKQADQSIIDHAQPHAPPSISTAAQEVTEVEKVVTFNDKITAKAPVAPSIDVSHKRKPAFSGSIIEKFP